MNDVLAKRYAKAILNRKDFDDFFESLSAIDLAFSSSKFVDVINSFDIKKEDKLSLILSFLNNPKESIVNFLKILLHNSRLALIPDIVLELRRQKALKEQIYSGIVYSKDSIEASKLKKLEESLSKKFAVNIKLDNKTAQDSGVKISLDELGYEISFSMQTFKTKISDYILKTI